MTNLVIECRQNAACDVCVFCGRSADASGGPQLLLAESRDAVCRDCGKKRSPSLVALLDLANVAHQVGRIGRHSVSPPMTSLLALARAAENYTCAAVQGRR
jgi:hypothetical protein